jgi:ATP-dependent helicase/nuclease subunit B
VPSRFLQRIAALAGDHHWKVCKARGNTLLRFANLLDDAGHPSRPVTRPEPRPPLSLRPQGLSITQIETWRRDPYSIYAQHILKLMPLDGIDADNAAAEFGTSLHSVLADFHTRYPAGQLPAEANNILLAIAEEHFAMRLLDPDFQTFKWPGALAFLNNFVAWENERRPRLARMIVEQSGKLTIPLADGSNFLLRGRADRLELAADGSVVIIDYKSGVIPTNAVINAGFSPQLTLEAAMIERGAFNSLPGSTKVSDAQYVPIGKDDEIKSRHVGNDGKPFEQLVAEHYSGLLQLANQFRDPVTPYLARPFPQFENKYGDYDHLARVKEWASSSGGEEG